MKEAQSASLPAHHGGHRDKQAEALSLIRAPRCCMKQYYVNGEQRLKCYVTSEESRKTVENQRPILQRTIDTLKSLILCGLQ